MFYKNCLFIFLILSLFANETKQIDGGFYTDIEKNPWHAAVITLDSSMHRFAVLIGIGYFENMYTYRGGAAIVGNRWLVTACHVVDKPDRASAWYVRVGSNKWNEGGTIYRINQAITHENCTNKPALRWDMGLIKLEDEIAFDNKTVQKIRMPMNQYYQIPNNMVVNVTGFGRESHMGNVSDTLKEATFFTRSCEEQYNYEEIRCMKNQFYESTTCKGDSGSPVVNKQDVDGPILVGVVRGGWDCIKENLASFIQIPYFREWIREGMDSP